MKENSKIFFAPEYITAKNKFSAYYAENILPVLHRIEQRRKKYLCIFLLLCCFVASWLGYVFFRLQSGLTAVSGTVAEENGVYGAIGCLLVLFACWPMFSYYKYGKENLLPLLAHFFGEFSYSFCPELPETLLDRSQLFKGYDKITGDDGFNGVYDGIAVNIAEYSASRLRHQRDSRSGRIRNVYVLAGRGIIFYAQMNKNFAGQTIVVKDKGLFNKLTRYKNLERAGLESPEFEKVFEVYTDNQVEARYILTTVMLEYMIELRQSFPKIEFSFFSSHVLVKIETLKNMFECSSFFRSAINRRRIEESFTELYLLFSIITTLRLNQNRML